MDLVSACLVGVCCRYDGKSNTVESLKEKYDRGELLAVCPELLGGLKTPRNPAELVQVNHEKHVLTQLGEDVTEAFVLGAYKTLEIAKILGAKKAYLKANSPSCGSKYIYDGTFSKQLVKGSGLTAELLVENGIVVFDEEDVSCKKSF